MTNSVLLGAHVSVAGGIHNAFERGMSIGCTTMQVFVKNASQWSAKPATDDDVQRYKTAAANARITPVLAHAAYLINLCAKSPAVRERSVGALADELQRCSRFSITALVFHPGAHTGTGEEEGIRCIAESINRVHERTPDCRVLTTLETTAGQGSSIGYRFEQLRAIIDRVEQTERMAVCLDTCHVFAAGYPIHTPEGYEDTFRQFDDIIGLSRLAVIHVNDSKKAFQSRVDRHAHIGKGAIGIEGFRLLMNDPRFARVPKVIETEKGEDMHEDLQNLNTLRNLVIGR